jgi:hypothetical protein
MRPVIPINSPHGYYEVGQYWPFLNKTEALHTASKYNKPVRWVFHENVFGSLDWTKIPTQTISELHRDRAQQIRDQYDYVIVNFSGGMDSWTVLHSFLSNNIHIDEIYTRWARKERNYKSADPLNTHESNLSSEFEYAVLPVLDYIKNTYPKINIVIDDYSEELEKDLPDNAVLLSNQYQTMPTFFRFNRKSEQEKQAEKQGKKIGVVYGCDKIRCQVENNNFYAYFMDCMGGSDSDPSRKVEMFYWSKDFPMIPVAHAHGIKNYIKNNFTVQSEQKDSVVKKQEYREIYQKVCYPEYNIQTLQVGKPLGSLVWESDYWIKTHNPRFYDSWTWTIF